MVNVKVINYQRLAEAQHYYTLCGYEYIEVPWVVEESTVKLTLPPDKRTLNGLVGSAEQSFLQMIKDGSLAAGKYQAITPCFRDEEVYDELHKPYFMKLELFDSLYLESEYMINEVLSLFNTYTPSKIISTNEGYDIVSDTGIELGSFGIRTLLGVTYIYGTGLAEPRMSQAING